MTFPTLSSSLPNLGLIRAGLGLELDTTSKVVNIADIAHDIRKAYVLLFSCEPVCSGWRDLSV